VMDVAVMVVAAAACGQACGSTHETCGGQYVEA